MDTATGELTLAGAGDCEVTVTAASTDDYNEAAATFALTVEGVLELTVDAIAGDDVVNIAEQAAGFAITGATGTESGVSMEVQLVYRTDRTRYQTIHTTSGSRGAWSVSVPAGASWIAGTGVSMRVTAEKAGFVSAVVVTRTFAVDLAAPSVSWTAPPSLQVGVALDAMSPSTSDTDIASYDATDLPSGLVIDSGSGAISGTPDTADDTAASATVTVTDTAGNSAGVSIAFPEVDKGDQVLSGFAYSADTVTYGDTAPTLTAPKGARGTLSYTATPSEVCSVDETTGALTLVGAGLCEVTVTAASTDNYNEATVSYTVTVEAAGILALTVDTIAGDDTVNIAEQTAGFAITGATGTETGVSVSVTVGSQSPLTATSDDEGAWSVSVPADASWITGTNMSVTVSASKTGYTSPGAVTRSVAVDLAAPSVSYTAPASLKVGVALDAMTPSSSDTDIASYSATGLPSGLVIDGSTGAIDGTPDTADATTASATVTVTDTAGNPADVSIAFPSVDKGDQTLSGFAYSADTVTYGDTAPTLTAPKGARGTLSYTATPSEVCTVDSGTGALTLAGLGSCEITATAASTANYNEATASYTVTVQPAGTLALSLDAIAGDGTVNIAEKTAGFAIMGATGTESGVTVSVTIGAQSPLTATSDDEGAWSVRVPADAAYLTGTSVSVSVSAEKSGYTSPVALTRSLALDLVAPSVSWTAPSSLQVGVALDAMTPSTSDTDIASYSATDLPSGLVIDGSTGEIDGTPDTADATTASATVTVTDTAGNPAGVSIAFPAVDKGDQTLSGFAYSADMVTFGDPAPTLRAPTGARGTLSYTATPSTVCSVDETTGALTLVGAGLCEVTVTAASTDNYNEATAAFTVTVQPAGTLALSLDTIAGDGTVNIAEKTAGFAITGATGTESGVTVSVTIGAQSPLTATSDDEGAWSVSVPADASWITGTSVAVSVSAEKTGFTSPGAVTRRVAVDLAAPSVSWTAPSSLQVGVALDAMTPSTSDTDIASYSATDLPSGLVIDGSTGEIDGTPDTADATTASATVTVTDTAGNPAGVSIAFPAVDKGDQTLSGFAYSADMVTFGDPALTLRAPTGARGTLSYTATPSTVCSVDETTGALTLVGAGLCEVTVTAASTDNYNEATAAFTVTVQPAGTLALSLDTIAGDGTVNIAEKTAGFAITGATGTESGVTVSVTIGAQSPLTATSDDEGAWSVSVPADASWITGTSVAVSVSAEKSGFTSPGAVTRRVAVDLAAPSVSWTAPSSLQVGVALVAMTPSTSDTDIASYSATGLPSGLVIDGSTGEIDGTPDTADATTASATVTVTDTAGNPAGVSIAFPAVDKGDQTLSGFAYSADTVTYGDTAPTLRAPTGARGTLSYTATPSEVCTVNATTGALTLAGLGSCVVTAKAASTDNYNEATASYTVAVEAAGTLALSLDTIAGDGTVNIAEKTAGFAITGATGTESGVSVSVTIIGAQSPLTATSNGNGAWSVRVPADASWITGTSVAVSVSAEKTGFTPAVALTRSVAVDLAAPSVSYTAPSSLQVGVALDAMTPSSSDTDIASYSATDLPSGLVIDTTTGAIDGTPDTASATTASATVTVTDTAGNPAGVSIAFPAVDKGDQTLSGFAYRADTVTYGAPAPTLRAPTGARGTLSYTATPSEVCSVDETTGALTFAGLGSCEITATAASTDNYNEATASYTVAVEAAGTLALSLDTIAGDGTVNIAEKTAGFAITGATGTESGVTVSVTIGAQSPLTATSDDDGAWSVSVPANAAWITGTSVSVTVSAEKTGFTSPGAVTRRVALDLVAPSVSYAAPASLKVGVALDAMTPSTSDTDIASYNATGLPSGLAINGSTGAIDGTPDTADETTASATVRVTDTAGNPTDVSIAFPEVDKGAQVLSGFAYSADTVTYGDTAPTLTAPMGARGTLSYTATPSEVCTVDSGTGALTLAGLGSCEITAKAASTADYNEATANYTVTVEAAGTLALTVDTIAGDDTVNIAEKTAGFAITGATGTETGVSVSVTVGSQSPLTATSDDEGAWSVRVPTNAAYITGTRVSVTVSAEKTGYTSPVALTRTLALDLVAPSVSWTAPSSLQVGVALDAMTPSTSDTDIASYSATDLPSGLVIDGTTGAIDGTPDTADETTASATVTVTDTAGNPADVSIAFPSVDKGDQVLSGFAYSADTVTYGDPAPTLRAPTGARGTLSYTATPSEVCTVNATTGALTLAGAGSCVITAKAASTANYNEATAAFTITVQPAALPVEVSFVQSTYVTGEDTRVQVGVELSADPGRRVVVPVTATGRNGADESDFKFRSPGAVFEAGETSTTTRVDIGWDEIDDDGERVELTFGTLPEGVTAGEITKTTIAITDDDTRGVRVSAPALAVPEGGSASYTVVLTSAPTEAVTVTVGGASGDVSVEPSTLTFTPAKWDRVKVWFTPSNWDTAQTVTVSAAEDDDTLTDDAVTLTHTVSGGDYGTVTADDVTVTVVEDDVSPVEVSFVQSTYVTGEDTRVQVGVELSADPGRRVVVPVTATGRNGADESDFKFRSPGAVFEAGETSTTTRVDIGWDEIDDDGESVELTFGTLPEGVTAGEITTTTIAITDDDTRGVRVSAPALAVPEGGSASYTVVLTSAPTAITVGGASGGATTAPAVTADDVTVTVVEDDVSPVEVSFVQSTYVTGEDTRVQVGVELSADPGRRVVVPVTATGRNGADESDFKFRSPGAVFEAGETSTTTRVDIGWDEIDDDGESVELTFGTLPEGVTAGEITTTTIAITDDDTRGVRVSAPALAVPEGGSASYTVVLTSAPTETVTVTVGGASGDVSVEPSTLTFTPSVPHTPSDSDWDTVRTVTVSAAEDDDALTDSAAEDGDALTDDALTLTHTVSGGDYGAVTADDVTVTVVDPVVTSVALVDAGTGAETALADGDALVLDDPANGSYGLVAAVSAEAGVGSVVLALTGAKTATATDNAAPYSLYGDEDGTVTGAGLPAGSYTLSATAYPEVDGAGAALGTLAVSFTVAASEAVEPETVATTAALTASFTGVPAEHGGGGESNRFSFELSFSENPEVSYITLSDHSFTVTGGDVKTAQRKTQGSNQHWTITVEPDGWGDVSLILPAGRACASEGAVCTADGKVLANTAVALVRGPLALSIADARIVEAANAVLAFEVTLNRAAAGTVTVDYASADGTATAGADYTAASGTLTFAPGETEKTVSVTVLDDAHDDTEETLTLTLSNATGARIRDGEATGTIENSDPIPQAWLARFGRTMADHVVDAVAARLEGSAGGGSQVTLAGRRIPLDGAGNGTSPGGTAGGDTRESGAAADTLAAFAERISGDGAGTDRVDWVDWVEGGGVDAATRPAARTLSDRDLLLGSSFVLALGGDGANGTGTAWTAWGRAAVSGFDGEADGLIVDGDVTTFTFGADAARGRWLGGVALAHSTGEGGFRDHGDTEDHDGQGSGTLESTLTGVHPYLRFQASERLSLWGVLGYGTGELTLELDTADERSRKVWETDTEMGMAAAGARGVLLSAADHDGFELAARGEARLVGMNSEAVTGAAGAGPLSATESQTSRVRFLLEGSHGIELAGGQTLRPSLEAGLRHDGGDAETGTGIELGAGVSYADPALGLTVEGKARGLLAHEDTDYREWGASASVRIDPGAAGRGLSLTLTPAWGADTGGAERLWSARDARALAANDSFEPAGRLEAEAGYGLGVFGGRGLMKPFAALSLPDAGNRTWRSGVRWTLGPDLAFGVEGALREAGTDNAAEHEIGFRATLRW